GVPTADINAPQLTELAGPDDAIQEMEKALAEKRIACRRLRTSHAFHSQMMDPIIAPFSELVGRLILKPPTLPYVSCVTGTWISEAEATDPVYWAKHFREPVRFGDAIRQLAKLDALLEVGPGTTLEILARQSSPGAQQLVVSSLPEASSPTAERTSMLNALGRLWLTGIEPNWGGVYAGEGRQCVSLPTYPFQRKRHWMESATQKRTEGTTVSGEQDHQSRSEGMSEMTNVASPVSSRKNRI